MLLPSLEYNANVSAERLHCKAKELESLLSNC